MVRSHISTHLLAVQPVLVPTLLRGNVGFPRRSVGTRPGAGHLLAILTLLGATLAWHAEARSGQVEKSDSKVKATATATKAGADRKQTVTITLDIAKGWHLYANPVNHNNEFLDGNQTTVKIAAKEKVKFDVKYPAGKTITDKKEKYDIYEGVVKIQAHVVRTTGDTSPLEINIAVSACDSKVCLQPGTVKLRVP